MEVMPPHDRRGLSITKEQYDTIIKKEKNPMFRLIFQSMWELGLRIGEVVGTVIQWCPKCKKSTCHYEWCPTCKNTSCKKKDHKYIRESKDYGHDRTWLRSLPGMVWEDIDRVKARDLGYSCKHTIHIHRKKYKEEDLPLHDSLYQEFMEFKPHQYKNRKIFDTHRSTVYVRLTKFGKIVSGKKPIHPHSLRRGMGVYETTVKGTPIQELQALYGHEKLQMTHHYIGMARIEALKSLARRRQSKYR